MATQAPQQPRPYNNGYLPNGASASGPVPGAAPLLPNQGRLIESGPARILCVADVRGNLTSLNELARRANANFILHTGDFGFYDERSIERIAEKTLKHVVQYSPLIGEDAKHQIIHSQSHSSVKPHMLQNQLPLSQLPMFLNKSLKFDVPVYTVWGACEDVQVLEKLRSGEYKIENLHIVDEAHSRLLEIGGVKLRLFGLGGAVVMHKLFDNGEGRTTIAGGQGTMWTTLLQMGELIDTANRVFDPSEVRILITHASPAREGLLNQLSVSLKVDFTISAGLHFRYGSSYNEYSVNPSLDHYRGKLAASKASFYDVWETVRGEVEPAVAENETQVRLLQNALQVVERMPSVANGSTPFGGPATGAVDGHIDEQAFKNMWNFNLADASFGTLVFSIEEGKVATEMQALGFNFTRRGNAPKLPQPHIQQTQSSTMPPAAVSGTPGSIAPSIPPQQGPVPGRGPTAASYPPNRQGQPLSAHAAQGSPQTRPNQSGPSPTAQPSNTRAVPPASPAPGNQRAAPNTPQPSANTSTEKGTPTESKTNGAATDSAKPGSPTVEKKQSIGFHVTNVHTEEEAKAVIPEADRERIVKIAQRGTMANIFFSATEDIQAMLERVSSEYKGRPQQGKPHVKIYEERTRGSFGPGAWQPGSRGGAQPSGGYRSGGASDSEGGRGGRGAFRGGARGRGADRGRGGRNGRGTNKSVTGDGTSPAPAASSTAAPPPAAGGS